MRTVTDPFPYPHYDYRPRLGPFLLGPNTEPENGVYCGDFFQYADKIPDNSIDLCFTDPVYWQIDDYRRLAEVCSRVLKPGGVLLVWTDVNNLFETKEVMSKFLDYLWVVIWHKNNEVKFRYAPIGKATFIPAVLMSKGKFLRPGYALDLRSFPVWHNESSNHKWSKPSELFLYYISKLSKYTATILDPFTGGGTVPAVCKQLGRRYLAFEIDKPTAKLARQRIRDTQPPLFTLPPEQAKLPEIA